MINIQATHILKTDAKPLVAGVLFNEEGQALVAVKEDGVLKVRPSLGLPGESFVGFCYSRAIPPKFLPKVEEFVIPDNGVVELARTPVLTQMLVKIGGVKATAIGNDAVAPEAGAVNSQKNVLYFAAADKGKKGVAQYLYEPTVSEAREVTGDIPQGGVPGQVMGQAGYICVGTVSISNFDASVDWSTVLHPNLGADGTLTVGGDGVLLTNVLVENSPTSEDEFLILSVKSY